MIHVAHFILCVYLGAHTHTLTHTHTHTYTHVFIITVWMFEDEVMLVHVCLFRGYGVISILNIFAHLFCTHVSLRIEASVRLLLLASVYLFMTFNSLRFWPSSCKKQHRNNEAMRGHTHTHSPVDTEGRAWLLRVSETARCGSGILDVCFYLLLTVVFSRNKSWNIFFRPGRASGGSNPLTMIHRKVL